jgi:hypothetical protein
MLFRRKIPARPTTFIARRGHCSMHQSSMSMGASHTTGVRDGLRACRVVMDALSSYWMTRARDRRSKAEIAARGPNSPAWDMCAAASEWTIGCGDAVCGRSHRSQAGGRAEAERLSG